MKIMEVLVPFHRVSHDKTRSANVNDLFLIKGPLVSDNQAERHPELFYWTEVGDGGKALPLAVFRARCQAIVRRHKAPIVI